MAEFILRDRPLAFDERQDAERIAEVAAADPEGAAWTIVVLRSLLERNGQRVEVLLDG